MGEAFAEAAGAVFGLAEAWEDAVVQEARDEMFELEFGGVEGVAGVGGFLANDGSEGFQLAEAGAG